MAICCLETPETYYCLRCIQYQKTEFFKFYSSVKEIFEICKVAVRLSLQTPWLSFGGQDVKLLLFFISPVDGDW